METKKHNTVILSSSVLIAIIIAVGIIKSRDSNRFESRVFKVVNGWGYDILVNDTVVIHQESVPVMENQQPFVKKEDAIQTAELVIQKLKNGEPPSLTKFDLEKIIRVSDSEIIKQGNSQ